MKYTKNPPRFGEEQKYLYGIMKVIQPRENQQTPYPDFLRTTILSNLSVVNDQAGFYHLLYNYVVCNSNIHKISIKEILCIFELHTT